MLMLMQLLASLVTLVLQRYHMILIKVAEQTLLIKDKLLHFKFLSKHHNIYGACMGRWVVLAIPKHQVLVSHLRN